MNADWVAASVRARSMARRRVGVTRCRELAAQPTLADGLALLADTVHGPRLAGLRSHDDGAASPAASPWPATPRATQSRPPTSPSLAAAEHAVQATTLWQLRVLSGWIPNAGRPLARALAAEYEAENILALADHLEEGTPTPAEYFDLGSLDTAWPRAQAARSPEELAEVLRTSRWGETDGQSALRDLLTLARLGRLSAESVAARPWARAYAGLIVSRILLVDEATPSRRLRQLARPLLGDRWVTATTLDELRDALPRPAHALLAEIHEPTELWLAEARHHATMEADALRLLRAALPGPDVVLGGLTVLAVDAWRVRAALAAAATGAGGSEVLDAVA